MPDMKKISFVFFIASLISHNTFAQNATIKIDVSRTIGEIDPNIYGVFMEPIHLNGRRLGLT
jgi:alpha-N-arabinofuranosidase